MDVGAFVLTVDDGREYLQLTDEEEWTSTIQCGTTIIMSVIMTQLQEEATPTKYQCPFCDRWNSLKGNSGKSSINWWVFHYLFNCDGCADKPSVDPASGDSRSKQLINILTRQKLQALPRTKRT